MPHGPFAKRRGSPAAYAVAWLHSPEGTKVNSPRRKPWVTAHHRTKPRRGGRDLSPLRGWAYSATRHCRPFGAVSFRRQPRARRGGPGPGKQPLVFRQSLTHLEPSCGLPALPHRCLHSEQCHRGLSSEMQQPPRAISPRLASSTAPPAGSPYMIGRTNVEPHCGHGGLPPRS